MQCTCWIAGRLNVLLHVCFDSLHIKVAAVITYDMYQQMRSSSLAVCYMQMYKWRLGSYRACS